MNHPADLPGASHIATFASLPENLAVVSSKRRAEARDPQSEVHHASSVSQRRFVDVDRIVVSMEKSSQVSREGRKLVVVENQTG